jgi:DNA repair exonuclease SbcCD nuclease subunit
MKIGMIGDAHLGCADYTEKRRADFALAFTNAIETCLGANVGAICLLGDVFDSALMRRNVDAFAQTIREVGPILDRLRREGLPLLAIAGNHEFGRGREAGELGVLESLGFLRVLRAEEVVIEGCGIAGVPWHSEDELAALPAVAQGLARASTARRRLLLLHNFVKGSKYIPSHLGEVEAKTAQGFDRVFVGHHHDAEEVGPFVMPGATEVQNIAEVESEKSVVTYDTASGKVAFHRLPRTRPTIMLRYDVAEFPERADLLKRIGGDIAKREASGAFVCIRISGVAPIGGSVTKADVHALLRGIDVFDRFVDIRTSRRTKDAAEAVKGATIDSLLRREFGREENKARAYVDDCTKPEFADNIVNELLR